MAQIPQETDLPCIAYNCVAIVSRRGELLFSSVSVHFYNIQTDPINFHVQHAHKQGCETFLFHSLKNVFPN